jgi:hypothetical protein
LNKLRRPTLLFLILFLLFSLAAVVLAVRRVKIEQAQKTVCFVMSYEDISTLSSASGESAELWCSTLARAGLQGVLLTPRQAEDPRIIRLVTDTELPIVQAGGVPQGGLYIPSLHYDMSTHKETPSSFVYATEALPPEQIFDALNRSGSLYVIMEKEDQTGNLLPEGWDSNSVEGPICKGFWLTRWCQLSFGRLGYSGTEETENILFRSVIDRGIQVLWLAPIYTESSTMMTDRFTYGGMLARLKDRLSAIGYSFGIPTGYEPYEPAFLFRILAGMAVLLTCLLLVDRLFRLPAWMLYALLGLSVLENVAGFFLAPNMQTTVLALMAAVCYPCLAVVLLYGCMERCLEKGRVSLRVLLDVLLCVLVALVGGVVIGALQSSREYLLVLRMFRGVKLSQFAVYAFAILYLTVKLFHQKGRSLREDLTGIMKEFRSKVMLVLLLLFVFAAGLVYLLRTGDQMLSVSTFEQRARSWLENVLYFRPRTKEFLLAWPSIGVALFFATRSKRIFCWLFGVFAAVGFASVANTFCHSRALFMVSLARTGYGIVIGMGLGLILFLLLRVAFKAKKQEAVTDAGKR